MFGRKKRKAKPMAAKVQAFKAAENGDKEKLIEIMAEYNLDINICDGDGDSLLQAAICKDRLNIFDYLMSEGIKINIANGNGKTEIYRATEQQSNYYVSELLKRNAKVDIRSKRGETALIQASYKGSVDILKMLLDAGADIETRDLHDDTALSNTSYLGHYDATKLLLEYGADISAKNSKGRTPEQSAEKQGYNNIVDLLKTPIEKKQPEVKRLALLPEMDEGQDNKPQFQWNITDEQEIARTSYKKSLSKKVTEIFNFKARYLMTIIENKKTQAENVLKESFEDIDTFPVEEACAEYEKMTGDKLEEFRPKHAQSWKNLNNDYIKSK